MMRTVTRLRVEKTIQQIIPLKGASVNIDDMISGMTPEIYQRLVTAVELGKWPDGVALTPEQKENSLQLVMLWQARNNTDAQHMTIDTKGQMVMKSKRELKEDFGITPKPTPMRGGTDGAALSAKGLLTPNFFTGAHNFHSKFEFLPLSSFEASYNTALQICLLAAR